MLRKFPSSYPEGCAVFSPISRPRGCEESYLRWSEGSFYYSISFKHATKQVLVNLADSAILSASPRRSHALTTPRHQASNQDEVAAKVPPGSSDGVIKQIAALTTQGPGAILGEVQSEISKRSAVPLSWPAFLPHDSDKQHPLYVNLISADADSYEIELGWTADCVGGNYCRYADFRAGTVPLTENDGLRIPVPFSGGIHGYFIDFTCAAYCDDAAVGWREGKYFYSIHMKAETKAVVIKVANSAIGAAHQQSP